VFTGIETDANADTKHTKKNAEKLRNEFRSAVFARFPSDRVRILEKPSNSLPLPEQGKLFQRRINHVAQFYRQISPSRYLFRPKPFTGEDRVPSKGKAQKGKKNAKPEFVRIEGVEWEIRMGCENIRSISDYAGMRMIKQYLKLRPDETLTPTKILDEEPDKKKAKHVSDDENLFDSWLKARRYKPKQLTKEQREELKKTQLQPLINEYSELRRQADQSSISKNGQERLSTLATELGDYQPLAAQLYEDRETAQLISELKNLRKKEDEGSLTAKEATRLEALHSELAIENVSQNSSDTDTAMIAFGRGEDVETTSDPTATKNQSTGRTKSTLGDLVRQRKKHVYEYLQRNGFQKFVEHLKESINDGCYKPKPAREWLTE
jgi:hypothetical protein